MEAHALNQMDIGPLSARRATTAFPVIGDYVTAMRNASSRFATLDVAPHLDAKGDPLFFAGNFAAVFKASVAGYDGPVAVKLFTRDLPDLERRHKVVAGVVEQAQARYLLDIDFLSDELFVTSMIARDGDYPVVLMPWVEGKSLASVVQRLCEKEHRKGLAAIGRAWANLCLDLLSKGIAHGDLKQDNVLVTNDGQMRLIDYDSFFAPPLSGLRSVSLGGPNFQHPRRDITHFDRTLDHFAMLVTALSLRALTVEPRLFAPLHSGENLILSREDFVSPTPTPLIGHLRGSSDALVRDWTERLVKACRSGSIGVPGLERVLRAARKATDELQNGVGAGPFSLLWN